VTDGVMVLSGTVPSYFLKQKAQTVLLALGCGNCVQNLLSVEKTPDRCWADFPPAYNQE